MPLRDPARLAALLDTLEEVVVQADADGRWTFVSGAWTRLTGRPVDAALGFGWADHVHPDDRAGQERLIGLVVRGERGAAAGMARYAGADGAWHPVEIRLRAVHEADGRLTGIAGTLTDISERLLAEHQVHLQFSVARVLAGGPDMDEVAAALLAAIGESMDWELGEFWLVDPARERLALEAFWRRDPDEGHAFEAIARGLSFAPGEGVPGRAWVAGGPVWIEDIGLERDTLPPGQAQEATGLHGAVGLPILDDAGRALAVTVFFSRRIQRPVPALEDSLVAAAYQIGQFLQRRRTEERLTQELQRSNEELSQFTSAVAHDLTEPLRTVGGFASLLARRSDALGDDDREMLDLIVDGTARMGRMLDGLRQLALAGSDLSFQPVDVDRLVSRTLAALRARLEDSGAEVSIGALPPAFADEAALGRVVQNLVENAIKFARPGEPPRISISGAVQGDRVEITVADNGIGIDPRHADQVFRMFRRLHTAEDRPGMGMGLAMCERIVERHGGAITVEPAEGGGSAFRFTLPAAVGAPVPSNA